MAFFFNTISPKIRANINIENIAVSIEGEYILNDYGVQSQRQLNEITNNRNGQMQTFTVEKLKERRP